MSEKPISGNSYESALKGASKKKNVIFNFKKTYTAWIILAVSLVLSVFVYRLMNQKVNDDRKTEFDKAKVSILTRLERKYETNQQILNSIRGLFERSFVVKDVFELNGSIPVSTYKSLLSIDFIYHVKKAGLNDFIMQAKSEGNYDFAIHPDPSRDEFYAINYIVPYQTNVARTGFDLGTEPNSVEAILTSKQENKITSTPTCKIRDSVDGFYMFYAVYTKDTPFKTEEERNKNFYGAIGIEINTKNYFEEAIGQGIASDSTLIFEIYDDKSNIANKVVFESKNQDILATGYKPLITEETQLKIANYSLKIKFYSVPNFGGQFQNYLPLITFLGALITSFVLFGFILSVITSRARAEDLAERMTRSQRRIVDTSQDMISVLNFDGIWQTMNNACNTILKTDPNSIIGTSIDDLFADKNETYLFHNLVNSYKDEFTERMDILMLNKENQQVWISWSFTVSKSDSLVYCIGRDVTLEKQNEQEQILRSKQIQLAEQFSREASESKTYFLTKLGHQLRNSLTGIVGYLQLVSGKVYESEEELDSFVAMAEESSEELFSYVSDLVDRAEQSDEATSVQIGTIEFNNVIEKTNRRIVGELGKETTIIVEVTNEQSEHISMVADETILSEALLNIYKALSTGMVFCEIQISAQENRHEGVTEIQILGSGNDIVSELILQFKEKKSHIIEALQYDKKDVMLHLATIDSNLRRMNGSLAVETFGGEEGNVVTITLPLNKKAE